MPVKLDRAELLRTLQQHQEKLSKTLGRGRELQPVPVAGTPRERVFSTDSLNLYYYPPSDGATSDRPPLLVVYSLVNRPYILDLKPGRSLLQVFRDAGQPVYLVDWGYPEAADRFLTLDDYVCDYLAECVEQVLERHDMDSLDLLGVCQGGTLAVCYAALFPEQVRKLVTLVTPVDFHAGASQLHHLAKHVDFDTLVDCRGNVSADLLNAVYVSLKPFQLLSKRYVELAELADDEEALADFLRMEQWMYDSPDQAGEAFRQFGKEFYQNNGLIHGEVSLGGATVDLGRLDMPICNVYASADHLVPPPSAQALGHYCTSPSYREIAYEGGHLGVFISGRAHKRLLPEIAGWLAEAP